FAISFLIVASLRSISGASSVLVSSASEAMRGLIRFLLPGSRGFRVFIVQRRTGGAFARHLPESLLDFQLSFPQPLLLGEGAVGIAVEPRRRLRDRRLERRPFDQQGDRLGQVLASGLRIGSFQKEGKAGVLRRRSEGLEARYGILSA